MAPTATLIGDVTVEKGASVWYGAVLRADICTIVVREGANVQDNSVIHAGPDNVVEIGPGATVAHSCVVHGAVLERARAARQQQHDARRLPARRGLDGRRGFAGQPRDADPGRGARRRARPRWSRRRSPARVRSSGCRPTRRTTPTSRSGTASARARSSRRDHVAETAPAGALRRPHPGTERPDPPGPADPGAAAADRAAGVHEPVRRGTRLRHLLLRDPRSGADTETVLALAIAVPTYVGFAVVVGGLVGTKQTLRALRWATSGREPDETERRQALRVPFRLTQMQGLLWVGGSAVHPAVSSSSPSARSRPGSRWGSLGWWAAASRSCSPSSCCARSRRGRWPWRRSASGPAVRASATGW